LHGSCVLLCKFARVVAIGGGFEDVSMCFPSFWGNDPVSVINLFANGLNPPSGWCYRLNVSEIGLFFAWEVCMAEPTNSQSGLPLFVFYIQICRFINTWQTLLALVFQKPIHWGSVFGYVWGMISWAQIPPYRVFECLGLGSPTKTRSWHSWSQFAGFERDVYYITH